MPYNLHKQQAPGSIIKNPTSARESLGLKSKCSGSFFKHEEHNFSHYFEVWSSISRGRPPCRQLVDATEGNLLRSQVQATHRCMLVLVYLLG